MRGVAVHYENDDFQRLPEVSQFVDLETLTEDVGRNERVISSVFYKAGEWRKTEQWREKSSAKDHEHRNWRRRSKRRNGGRRDVRDLPSALVALRTARVTRAGHGGGDVLHSVDTKRQRNRDELVTSQPSVERGSPHIWFVTAKLWETENVVAFPDHAEEFFDRENEWNELHDGLEREEDPWASMGMDDAEETLPKDKRPEKDAAADSTPRQHQEDRRLPRRESQAKDEMGLSSG